MKDEMSIPIVAVGGMIVVGAVVATAAVFQAYDVGQKLDLMLEGRMAAILHLVLRGAMVRVVQYAAILVSCWQYWRMASETWRKLLPLLLVVKIGTAVFAASSVTRFCSMLAIRLFPALMHPFAALGGWRPFQMLDLALLFALILLFVALADRMQRKVEEVRSKAVRVAFAAFAVCLFVVFTSPIPCRIVREFIERHQNDATEGTEELDSPKDRDDDYRIDVDEPWEIYACQ